MTASSEKSKTAHLEQGARAEDRALAFLSTNGLTLVQRNYKSHFGEIDLIMLQDKTVVFIEVRFRRNSYFGSPAETVNKAKQKKLTLTAEQFLQSHSRYKYYAARFDVVAIVEDKSANNLDWIQNAFDCEPY